MGFRAGFAAVLVLFSIQAFATQCGDWRWLHPSPKVSGPAALGWNGSRIVGVGALDGTFFSNNGRDWTPGTAANRWDTRAVAGSPTRWVAVGYGRQEPDPLSTNGGLLPAAGTIEISTDGLTWTTVDAGEVPGLNSVIWTGSKFVAVGRRGTVLTSPDGLTWTRRTAITEWNLNAVTSSPSKILAVGVSGVILTSQTGEFWEAADVGGANKPMYNGVAWTGSRFVAAGAGTLQSSDNGIQWAPIAIPNVTIPWLYGVVSNGQQTLAWSAAKLLASTDGNVWSTVTPGFPATPSDIVWAGTQFVAARNGGLEGMTSTDGRSWEPMIFGSKLTDADLKSVFLRADRMVAVGRDRAATSAIIPVVVTSGNAETWSMGQAVGNAEWLAVSGNERVLVAVGANGSAATSVNGTEWTPRNSGVTQRLLDIAWSGSQFVAVGESGTIITSSDGVTWQIRMNNTINAKFHRVMRTDLRWIALGQKSLGGNDYESVLYTSTDGTQWTQVTFPSGMHMEIVAQGGPRMMAVGSTMGGGTMAMSSGDGLAWTHLATPVPEALVDLVWIDDRYAGVSKTGLSFLTSRDGSTWSTESIPIAGLTPYAMRRAGDKLIAVGEHGGIAAATCSANTRPAATNRPAISAAGESGGLLPLAAIWWWLRRPPNRQRHEQVGFNSPNT